MDFHYTVTTKKTVDEAILSLDKNLKEQKFGILWQLDLTSKLLEKGVKDYTNPFRILEVCNPVYAARVLNLNELAGYFLPCKITVYQSGGKIKIGLLKPTVLVSMLSDSKLKMIAEEVESILVKVLDESK